MVEIKICNGNEIELVKKFIDTDWSPNHILAKNTTLLKWQHFNEQKDNLNFVIALDSENNEIVGLLGFIPTSQFDKNLIENKDYWLAIWKIRAQYKGVGMELLNFFVAQFNPNSIGSIGINKIVRKLYKVLRYKTDTLLHYYFLNPEIKDFKIAQVNQISAKKSSVVSKYQIQEISEFSSLIKLEHNYYPKKSIAYLENRYKNHPIYHYQFYVVKLNDKAKCILITRKISVNQSSCLRLVDVYGNFNLENLASELEKLLSIENAEYIDCLNFGIEKSTFENMGFSLRENIIIPNYFEPYEAKNVDIDFAILSKSDEYIIFKGDSDQDRPNKI